MEEGAGPAGGGSRGPQSRRRKVYAHRQNSSVASASPCCHRHLGELARGIGRCCHEHRGYRCCSREDAGINRRTSARAKWWARRWAASPHGSRIHVVNSATEARPDVSPPHGEEAIKKKRSMKQRKALSAGFTRFPTFWKQRCIVSSP
jgi:hypothetical protein